MITLALAWKVRLVNHTTLATTVPFADLSTCAYEFFRNLPDGRLTAPRLLDFEVAETKVEHEDVNNREHRLAELSRFVAQMAPPTLCSISPRRSRLVRKP